MWRVFCPGSSLCTEGLLQDFRQHCAPSWNRGAAFYGLLWMPRSAATQQILNPSIDSNFCSSNHVFTCVHLFFFFLVGLFSGELPECTQDLMIDVTKSYYQKFLPLSQIWVLAQNLSLDLWLFQPGPVWGLSSDWNGPYLLFFCSQWPWVFLPSESHFGSGKSPYAILVVEHVMNSIWSSCRRQFCIFAAPNYNESLKVL